MAKGKGLNELHDVTEEFAELLDDVKNDLQDYSATDRKNLKNYDVSRGMATKVIWTYIKKHDLQDPDDGRVILLDDVLKDMAANCDKLKGKKSIKMTQVGTMVSGNIEKK
jgi:chromatin remodeling complex protein RSC6